MVLAVAVVLALAGCQGDETPDAATTSVQAFPDAPHVSGPLTVELRPALSLVFDDRRCRPDPAAGQLCSSDGSGGYRVLGTSGPLVVAEVGTAPSADHTSWRTTVRFAPGSRDAVRRVREQTAGIGGVVVVTVGDAIVMVATPPELHPGRILRLGLGKAEAWSLVDAFG
ncbi:hypothetical protein ASC77_13375 [Nocardioides sp. Root1257]|uniref:hypothetical protein n=1 Tax=unclassified Nocardioides TaxID=2615069 RepID=UPI0006FE5AC6|nr:MULTISPECIES: hypothetical protein [unclassified Nocardioides]KQW47447.1 hypothetical protein ASC77_13375 [Nocardioides sp. Root1257]KRC45603.1 hypothetical protein ASE24_13380 [Nocardioides sp. Root224]